MVLFGQHQTFNGPFCRQCGIAQFRAAMNHTLLAGWWGVISFFLNWRTIIANLEARRAVVALAEPTRAFGSPAPMPVGRPVSRRAGVYVVAAIAVGAVLIVAVQRNEPRPFDGARTPQDLIGRCIHVVDGRIGEGDCSSREGRISRIVTDPSQCPSTSINWLRVRGGSIEAVACVAREL
jgi:hypothetical protein